ncbi:MAG: queuosine precursor transporter [Planctomycetia bacterium]|nr:queuosine precursor transporter [Planctomycetia bacterium]
MTPKLADPPGVTAPVFTIQHKLYVWLCAFFVACLIIADIVGIKLFRIPLGFSFWNPFGKDPIDAIEHTCGMLTFPVTFLLTDLLNEYYGKRAARRVTYIGLVMALFVFGVMNLSVAMPRLPKEYNVDEKAFEAVLGSAQTMYLASITAYLVGQLSDIWIFHALKRLTRGRFVWLRATGSTVVSQLIDSFIVSYLAFSLGRQILGGPDTPPPAPFIDVLKIAATGYMLKFVVAIAITPCIYAGHGILHRLFGLEPLPPDDPRV